MINRSNPTQRDLIAAVVAATLIASSPNAAPVAAQNHPQSHPASAGCVLEPYADCTGADLRSTDCSGMDLTGIILHQARLDQSDFSNTILRGADLTEATTTGALWSHTTCPNGRITTGTACGVAITASESGFSRIDSIDYYFQDRTYRRSYATTPAMIWYSFHPAEPAVRPGTNTPPNPLFVMLNGGPGAATTANLFANNTAPYALSADETRIPEPGFRINPNRWTRMGHLLYIDAPLTGFSYNIGPADFNDYWRRLYEALSRGNFNPFIDAAQVLRVLLRFLDSHEELRDSPVVFVGESYGGTRVSTMLNLLLFSHRYDSNVPFDPRLKNYFHDGGLVQEIRRHLKAQAPAIDPRTDAKAATLAIAEQFGHQILIQPQLSPYQIPLQGDMYWRLDSVMNRVLESRNQSWEAVRRQSEQLCNAIGHSTCVTQVFSRVYDYDAYNWDKERHWTDELEASAISLLTQPGKLNAVLGDDVGRIRDLKPDRRNHLAGATAYKDFGALAAIKGYIDWIFKNFPDNQLRGLMASQEYIADRLAGLPRTESLEWEFGPLGDRDGYFSSINYEVYILFAVSPDSKTYPIHQDKDPIYGDFFLENVRLVDTFLSDADRDLVIYSPALPVALTKHTGAGVRDIVATSGGGSPGNRRGTFRIRYDKGPDVQVFYPRYVRSGHAVGTSQPEELRDDVAEWLACVATASCFRSAAD